MTTQARVAAVVLAVLAVLAAYNTAFVIGEAVRRPSPGRAAATVGAIAVTCALAYGGVRIWRRGADD